MTPHHVPRSPRLPLLASTVLAAAGLVLLSLPHAKTSVSPEPAPSPAQATPSTAPRAVATSSPAEKHPLMNQAPTVDASASSAPVVSALPPHGEGTAGDRAIQLALEAAWHADLASADERQLRAAGAELLRADATGTGRTRWPGYFRGADRAVAPAFAVARFRVQAVIARRGTAAGWAVVHLVWAGTDRGGTYTDGRITDLYFTRTTATKKGGLTWTPRPRP